MASWFEHKLLKNIWDKSGIESLNSRERWVLFGGIVFVVCFLVFQLGVVPLLDAQNNQEKAITRKKQDLVKIRELQREYQTLKNVEGTIQIRIDQRGTSFTLFTFLDRQADQAKVKKQIKYMKPSTVVGPDEMNEAMVEMKLQGITLEALVEFLRLVESEQNVVFIRRFSLQESGDGQGYFDSILQIMTFEKKE